MRTVWFVNSFFHPDHSATSQILSDVAFHLADRGWKVQVVAGRPSYDGKSRFPNRETIRGVGITRVPSLFGKGRGMAARLGRYAGMYLGATWTLLTKVRAGDVVVCKTDPPLLSVPLAMAARLRGAKLVNWLQDLYPEVAIASGVRMPASGRRVLMALRDRSLASAAMNVAIGHVMARHLRAAGIAPARISILPNFTDDAHIRPLSKPNALRSEWGLDDRFVLGYSGNLGRAHDTQTFVDMASLLAHRSDIMFLFIGGGHQFDAVRDALAERNVCNVRFEGYVPREQLNYSLAVPDAHWLSLKPNMEGLIVPSKVYGIMAAGRPIIAVGDPQGEIAQILHGGQAGFQIAPGDAQGFAQAVLALADDAPRAREMGTNARAMLDADGSRAIVLDRWETMLSRVIDPSGRGADQADRSR